MYFLNVEDIRALDAEAIAGGTPGALLMERAGYAAFFLLRKVFAPEARRFLVLGGCGNNGGDAWVAARYLIQEGLKCDAVLLGDPARLKGDALLQFRRLEGLGARIVSLKTPEGAADYIDSWRGDVILDGMCGSGFKGGANALLASAVAAVNRNEAKTLALDIPSGLPADGDEPRLCVKADWTAAFAQGKLATLTEHGRFCGRTEVVDIGCPRPSKPDSPAWTLSLREASELLPRPAENAHKYKRGHLLLLAGSEGMGGAALLAAESASCACGMVTAAVPASLVPALNARSPQVLTVPLSGKIEEDLAKLAPAMEKAHAFALGCGWPEDEYHAGLLKILCAARKPQVWDAGALAILSDNALDLPLANREILLTPHEGEFQRLTGALPPGDDTGRLRAVRDAVENFECCVLLKGRHTVVGAPRALPYLNLSGNAFLATAGAGDVLTGLAGAFLSQEMPCWQAAALAAYYHGLAGDLLAARGPFNASRLAGAIPAALHLSGI